MKELSKNLKHKFKVVTLGESSVGKSSIVIRLYRNEFHMFDNSTIGASYIEHTMELEDDEDDDEYFVVKLGLWDTAGQERYHCLSPMYVRGAHVVILVFDLTNKDSFERIKTHWLKVALNHKKNPIKKQRG